MSENHLTRSERETEELAAALASTLRPGDLLALRGGLGAGKTAFVRGLARGMGIDPARVSSPTFSLVNEYREGERTLVHFDMYRIGDEDGLYHTGFFDYLDSGAVLAVEWSENVADWLPERPITVTISPRGETVRAIRIDRIERGEGTG